MSGMIVIDVRGKCYAGRDVKWPLLKLSLRSSLQRLKARCAAAVGLSKRNRPQQQSNIANPVAASNPLPGKEMSAAAEDPSISKNSFQ